jgi:hypothetical protein
MDLLALCRRHLKQTYGDRWEKTLLAPAARLAPPRCGHRLEGRARQIFHRLRHGGRYPAAAFTAYPAVGTYAEVRAAMAERPAEALSLASHWVAKVEWTLREAPLLAAGAEPDEEVSFHDDSDSKAGSEGEEAAEAAEEAAELAEEAAEEPAEGGGERAGQLAALRRQRLELEAKIEEGERRMRSLHGQLRVAVPPSLSHVLDVEDVHHEPSFTLPVLDLTS